MARDSRGRFVRAGGGSASTGGSGGSVRVIDRGAAALLKRLADQARVTVGVHDTEGSAPHGEATLLDVAAFHEFGTSTIPARSFIRGWVDENEKELVERMRALAQAVIKGELKSVDQALERFGVHAVGDIQKRIADGIEPELAESTIQRKGSSTPLIDTGQLRSSITYKVQKT